jgi:hypothetical protein
MDRGRIKVVVASAVLAISKSCSLEYLSSLVQETNRKILKTTKNAFIPKV